MSDIKKIKINEPISGYLQKDMSATETTTSYNKIECINLSEEVMEQNARRSEETLERTMATIVVGINSIGGGVAKLGEYVGDGAVWLGGEVGCGFLDLVGLEDVASDVRNFTEDYIAVDRVRETQNKMFSTELGQYFNEKSYMKYDSDLAKTIENISVKGAEIAAATAITVATGGLGGPVAFAAVFGAGFTEGVGKSAEERYSDSSNISHDTMAIVLDGIGSGLNWYSMGKLGEGAVNSTRIISETGVKESFDIGVDFFRNGFSNLMNIGNKFNRDFLVNTMINGLFDLDNFVDSAGVVVDNITDAVNGREELDIKKMFKELMMTAYGSNCLFDGFINIFSRKHINDVEEIIDGMLLNNIDSIVDNVGSDDYDNIN